MEARSYTERPITVRTLTVPTLSAHSLAPCIARSTTHCTLPCWVCFRLCWGICSGKCLPNSQEEMVISLDIVPFIWLSTDDAYLQYSVLHRVYIVEEFFSFLFCSRVHRSSRQTALKDERISFCSNSFLVFWAQGNFSSAGHQDLPLPLSL
jgi:hypothetical protein